MPLAETACGRDDRVWNDRGKPTSMFAGLCTFKRNQSTNYRLAYFSPFQPMAIKNAFSYANRQTLFH